MEAGMSRSEDLKKIADNCVEMAEAANDHPKRKRFERLADGWKSVAQSQARREADDTGPKAA